MIARGLVLLLPALIVAGAAIQVINYLSGLLRSAFLITGV